LIAAARRAYILPDMSILVLRCPWLVHKGRHRAHCPMRLPRHRTLASVNTFLVDIPPASSDVTKPSCSSPFACRSCAIHEPDPACHVARPVTI
jgi:hypothetical protein